MELVGHLEPDKPRLRARVHSCFLGVWGGGFPETPRRPGCQPAGRAPGASCLASGAEAKHINKSHNYWLVLVQSPLCPWPGVVLLGPRLPLL